MSKKLKERKKYKKARETKAALLERRERLRKKQKYEASLENDLRKNREKGVPIINPHKEKLRKQEAIRHNMELLKGLEEDYKKEQAKRRQLNKRLEDAGHTTLVEKMQAMGEQATKDVGGESLIEKTRKTLEMLHGDSLE